MSDSVRPHRWQPSRLPRPWDSPGKNTGVGCHFLLQYMKVKSPSEVAQSCPTPSDPMDCSLPGSSIHGIFQARVLGVGCHLTWFFHSYFFFYHLFHSSDLGLIILNALLQLAFHLSLLPASPGNYPTGRTPWPLWVWPGSAEQHQALLSAGLLLPGTSWRQRELSPLAFGLRNGTTGLVRLHSR